jgi:hypothetical protein
MRKALKPVGKEIHSTSPVPFTFKMGAHRFNLDQMPDDLLLTIARFVQVEVSLVFNVDPEWQPEGGFPSGDESDLVALHGAVHRYFKLIAPADAIHSEVLSVYKSARDSTQEEKDEPTVKEQHSPTKD